jgi:hypothetical protein
LHLVDVDRMSIFGEVVDLPNLKWSSRLGSP